jgi:site-specific recombinase XerD
MVQDFFQCHAVLPGLSDSVYWESIEKLTNYLQDRGHTERMMREYLRVAVHFTYWVATEGIVRPMDEEETVRRFRMDHLASCRCPVPSADRVRVRAGLKHLMHVFRMDGHVISTPKCQGPVDTAIEQFEGHLMTVCGVSASTCRQYTRFARQFLKATYGDGPIDLEQATVNDVQGFITQKAANVATETAKATATSVRSFLRYMAFWGHCDNRLAEAVPTIPHWRMTSLPKNLDQEQVRRLLQAFDLSTEIGRRDHAIVLCLIRLGLRANEIARLSLDEIDWRKGLLHIHHGKGQRQNLLPLAADIGREIAHYIRHDRPATQQRYVFLQHRPPIGERLESTTVQAIVRRAFRRSGIATTSRGSHVLRHTAATRMIQAGVTIKEVADILGHRCISTTGIYAKVDLPALRGVVTTWPQVQ